MNFSKCGYELLADFLPAAELADMRAEFNQIEPAKSSGGIRNAERQFASVARYIQSGSARAQAKRYLTGSPQLVRAILFNKTALNNWMVPLHQDKTVCLTSKIADPAWGPWSIKDDVLHVQPPIHVLDSMDHSHSHRRRDRRQRLSGGRARQPQARYSADDANSRNLAAPCTRELSGSGRLCTGNAPASAARVAQVSLANAAASTAS